MKIECRMKELGITLPAAPKKGGVYSSVKELGAKQYYISGCGNLVEGKGATGKVGADVTLQEGKAAAEQAMLNFISVIKENLGSLEQIKSFSKILVFVSSSPDFYEQPKVADGATEILVKLFGEEIGMPSRSAVGVAVLPGNIPVEIEGIVELY